MAQTSREKIPLPDGVRMQAFLAIPTGTAPEGGRPAMLAIHDIAG
jgi:hypothetical protein